MVLIRRRVLVLVRKAGHEENAVHVDQKPKDMVVSGVRVHEEGNDIRHNLRRENCRLYR